MTISRHTLGSCNRLGLLSLALAAVHVAAVARADSVPTVRVDGRMLVINGTDDVSPAMFGVHHAHLTAQHAREWGIDADRFITQRPEPAPLRPGQGRFDWLPPDGIITECVFDRYQPAWPLVDRQWRRNLQRLGAAYGRAVRGREQQHLVEFWNEPYLNWATRPGVNYDGIHYNIQQAREGAPVISPLTGQVVEAMEWYRGLRVVNPRTGAPNYLAWRYAPSDVQPGQTFDFRGVTYRVEEGWLVRDTRRQHWWAGPHDYELYSAMLDVFGNALKRANPRAQLLVGWDFHIFQDGWASWRNLYRPLIDDHIDIIDGITEHHYGGDTRRVAVSYEVVWAYTVTTHGKSITFHNTEAGGMMDPEQPGSPQPAATGPRRAIGAMTYTLRDILYMLAFTPDKARSRASHQPRDNGGEEFAFRLLRPVRGRLMHAESNHSGIWPVAVINGRNLTVAAFNDTNATTAVAFDLAPPSGTTLAGGVARWIDASESAAISIRETSLEAAGVRLQASIDVPARSALVLTIPLRGNPARNVPVVQRRQFPAPLILEAIGDQLDAEITLAEAFDASGAAAAALQLCLSGDPGPRFTLSVNDVTIPFSYRGPITRIEVPLEALGSRRPAQLSFRDANEGVTLLTASILVDREE